MATENLQINLQSESEHDLSALKPFTFTDYLLKQLPEFYAEKIIGNEQYKFLKYLNVSEDILDNVRARIKKFYDSLSLDKAHPKYLYQLGLLLGIEDLVDLTNSYDLEAIKKQRITIKETIDRYVTKGTAESITRLLYGMGLFVSFEYLWTKDFNTYQVDPDEFIKNYILSTDASGIYEDDVQYFQEYVHNDDYDIIAEIDASLGYASGIDKIHKIILNDYNFTYLLSDVGLFYMNSNKVWNLISSTATDFLVYDNRVFIKDSNELKIYHYNDFNTLKFSQAGCIHIEVITSFYTPKEYLLIDSGTEIILRDPVSYTHFDTLTKLNSNSASFVTNREDDDFIIWNLDNKEFYTIRLDETTQTLSYSTSAVYSYSTILPETITKVRGTKVKNKWVTLFNITSDNKLISLHIFFNNYSGSSFNYRRAVLNSAEIIKDVAILDEEVLFYLTTSGIGTYYYQSDVIEREFTFYDAASYIYRDVITTNYFGVGKTGNVYKFHDNQNKLYLVKDSISTGKFTLDKFYGWLYFGGKIFKTHYFNTVLSGINSTILPSEVENLKRLIDLVKPAHTELQEFKYGMDSFIDTLPTVDTLSSGISAAFPLYFDGTIETSYYPVSSTTWYCSGGEICDGYKNFIIT